MELLDGNAIKELSLLLASRGVEYHTAKNISLVARRVTRKMIAWLEAHPDATPAEMSRKAMELNRER